MNHKYSLAVLFIITAVAGVLLLSGSKILVFPLLTQPYIPAGTFITWTGLITWAFCFRLILLSLYSDKDRHRQISTLSLFFILPAIWWGLISYGLAGNWEFNFSSMSEGFQGSPKASQLFWYYSWITPLVPVVLLFVIVVGRQIAKCLNF